MAAARVARDHVAMPKDRGARTRVADGIYRDATGYEVAARAARQARWKRFPLDTDLKTMRAWQDDTRSALRKVSPIGGGRRLRDCVADYLGRLPAGPSKTNRAILLAHWVEAFGDRPALSLTRGEIVRQLEVWRATKAASTCNHRLSELRRLYRVEFADRETWPTDQVRRQREPKGEARDIPLAVLDALIASMPESKSKARLALFAATGIPPARIKRLRPEHIDLVDGTLYLEGRQKGAGTLGRRFPLSAAAQHAVRDFLRARAFGDFRTTGLAGVWRHAIDRTNRRLTAAHQPTLPAMRMYDIRHAFGARLYALTGDIRAVAELMDITIETALRYTRAAVPQALRNVVAALDRARMHAVGGHQDGAATGPK